MSGTEATTAGGPWARHGAAVMMSFGHGATHWIAGTLYVFGISLLGFAMFAVRPVLQGWMMDSVPPQMAGSATSFMFSVQSAKSMLTPVIGGFIADAYGLEAVFYFLAFVLLLANLVAFLLPKDEPAAVAEGR